jgi:hypothetical protein
MLWVPYKSVLFAYLQREWEDGHTKIRKGGNKGKWEQREWGEWVSIGHTRRAESVESGGSVDTPQAPYPRIDRSRPTVSDAYRSSYAECQCDDSSHTQSRRHFTLHSYASNRSNAQRSRSVLLIIVFTLISYDTHLSLIIFKIIPHPMTLLIAFPLQVIILHSI